MFLSLPAAIPTSVFRDVDSIKVYLLPGTREHGERGPDARAATEPYRMTGINIYIHTSVRCQMESPNQIPIRLLTNYIKQFALAIAGGIFIRLLLLIVPTPGGLWETSSRIRIEREREGVGRIGRKGLKWDVVGRE